MLMKEINRRRIRMCWLRQRTVRIDALRNSSGGQTGRCINCKSKMKCRALFTPCEIKMFSPSFTKTIRARGRESMESICVCMSNVEGTINF